LKKSALGTNRLYLKESLMQIPVRYGIKTITIFLCLFFLFTQETIQGSPNQEIPVFYNGRPRPFAAYSHLWTFALFQGNPLDSISLWQMHLLGHGPWDDTSLFAVRNKKIRSLLGLSRKKKQFSFHELQKALSSSDLIKQLISHSYTTTQPTGLGAGGKIELSALAQGLWVLPKEGQIVIAARPDQSPWNLLQPGDKVPQIKHPIENKEFVKETTQLIRALDVYQQVSQDPHAAEKTFARLVQDMLERNLAEKDIAVMLEMRQPLIERLRLAGQDLKILPAGAKNGEWFSLRALKVKVFDPAQRRIVLAPNFTAYSDATFAQLRKLYSRLEDAANANAPITSLIDEISKLLLQAYEEIAGTPYIEAYGKSLFYPALFKLKAESVYYQAPLFSLCAGFYFFAFGFLFFGLLRSKKSALAFGTSILLGGFGIHSAILGLRWAILARPPVSNMFETILYVPWVAVLFSLLFAGLLKDLRIVFVSSSIAFSLFLLLIFGDVNGSLEHVQPVLDSQLWLLVHVLMVVGSYGLFALSGFLGHLYIFYSLKKAKYTPKMDVLGRSILHSMQIGCILLIPGTLLGGVWAAESWGRFWDWDPKEAWAFISACVYLMCIHAYRFRHIGNFGLALGSVIGLQAVIFTWYGVNYILGTGLHSYGFGSGGEMWYFYLLLADVVFISAASILKTRARVKSLL